jgi:transposase
LKVSIGVDRCEHGNRNALHECNIACEKCLRVVHSTHAIRYYACMRKAIHRTLPNNVATLRTLVIDLQAQLRNRDDALQARDAQLQAGQQELVYLRTWIEKLKWELARLRRMQFGRSSEQLSERIEQLELLVGELEISAAQPRLVVASLPARKPVRKPLPQHLPRESVIHAPDATCPDCGTAMQRIGEDVSEMLEYVPARFKVIRHIRPKLSCACCQRIVQVPAPIRPIDHGLPGPALLAHIAVSKFADSLPLYRQAQICARLGVELERSTLAGWLGGVALLIRRCWTRSGATCWPRTSCTRTTPRFRCWNRVAGKPRPDGCGRTCAMIGRRGAPSHRRCGSNIRRTARGMAARPSAVLRRRSAGRWLRGL